VGWVRGLLGLFWWGEIERGYEQGGKDREGRSGGEGMKGKING